MSGSAANTLWARSFADELARCGVREVVVAPGSRSTPLVMAFAADGRFTMRVHLDERSAAFFALGVGKVTGRPAVLITTSGTAVANVFPAVVEASQSGVPLLVLSADRPHRLRDADANQAIDQVGIYGRFPRGFFEAAPPTLDDRALRHLRAVANRAVASATGPDAGPVHVNFPFDKPLEPSDPPADFVAAHPLAASGRPDGAPFVAIETARARLADQQVRSLLGMVDGGHGVIVAGPNEEAGVLGPAVLRFAAATGFPLLADPISGARYGPTGGADVVPGYDFFLRDESVRERLAPSLVIRVGASPTSAALQTWLETHADVLQIVIDEAGRFKDHGAAAAHYLRAQAADALDRLSSLRADPEWAALWRSAGSAVTAATTLTDATREPHEGDVLAVVCDTMPAGGTLWMSSSMPIRDLDAYGRPREQPLHVLANRGASGIDGVVSSAFGAASQAGAPTVCVIGDVAFFHDQNGLLWSREPDAKVVFVLIDNDGGGIFHMLPIAENEPEFTRFFATPHGIDASHAAAAHGIGLRDVAIEHLAPELETAIAANETIILRVRTDRAEQQRLRSEVRRETIRSVREALG